MARKLAVLIVVLASAAVGSATRPLPAAAAVCTSPQFGPARVLPAAAGSLVPADFDLDGRVDVAVGGTLLYGDGAGGLGAPQPIGTARAMAAVDLGGVEPPIGGVENDAPELVARVDAPPLSRATVGLGTGHRATPFTLLAGLPGFDGTATSATAADLTGDHVPELVVGYGAPTNTLFVWPGEAGGPNWRHGIPPVAIPFDSPVAVEAADLDDDGTAELLALSQGGNVLAEFNYSGGKYLSKGIGIPGGPRALAVADLDGDGVLDTVTVTASGVTTVPGTGEQIFDFNGTVVGNPFGTPKVLAAGGDLVAVALGDLTGDQRLDAVAVDRGGQTAIPLTGDGSGGFAAGAAVPAATPQPSSVSLVDLDGNGALDLVSGDAGDPSVAVRLNTCQVTPVDIAVTAVEVTQGIQDLANSVPLVAGRRTFVRVHARAGGIVDGVTARLLRTDANGTPIDRPLWPANPAAKINVKAGPARANLNDSFLFELPSSWTTGELHLRAEVNPGRLPVETGYANNTRATTVAFLPTDPVKIELIKVQFTWAAGQGTDCGRVHVPTDRDLDSAESALRRQLPGAQIVISRSGPWDSGLTMDCAVNFAGGVETGMFLEALKSAFAAAPRDRIRVGIVDRSPIGGIADGTPSWFSIAQTGSADTVTHEVGHNLGQRHVESTKADPCNASELPAGINTAFPYAGGRIGGPAANPDRFAGFDPGDASFGFDPRRVLPPETGDMMGYCRTRWPSDYTWTRMRDTIQASFAPGDPPGDFITVTGVLGPAGRPVGRLSAVRRPQIGALDPPLPGSYRIQLLDAHGGVLSQLPFAPRRGVDDAPTRLDETLPFVAGTRQVRVLDPAGRRIGSLPVSARAPAVSGVAVSTGTSIPAVGPVTISWTATDADHDRLVADVLWSRDDAAFEPLANGITASQYTIDASRLSGTKAAGSGVVRVVVRDPVNSAVADRPGLTTVDSAPRLRIGAPWDGQSFVRGQTVILQPQASDAEDGDLTDKVTWWSDRDGNLGTGRVAGLLSVGVHTLTARSTDSAGRTTSASTTVRVFHVLPPGSPPVAEAGPDQTVDLGATVELTALGSTDADGDALSYSWRVTEAPPGSASAVLDGPAATPSFVARQAGAYVLELTASDLRHGSSTDVVTIAVAGRHHPDDASFFARVLVVLVVLLVILAILLTVSRRRRA